MGAMLNVLLFAGLLVGLAVVLWFEGKWFFSDAARFVAPDTADRDAINAKYGAGTPEARAALAERFGPDSHWRDAATGLSGLAGVLLLVWAWFG